MLYREIIAVCSEIHTKHINTLCGQNVELVNVKLVVHIVTNRIVIDIILFSLYLPKSAEPTPQSAVHNQTCYWHGPEQLTIFILPVSKNVTMFITAVTVRNIKSWFQLNLRVQEPLDVPHS
jgi:hypothetical protein